MSLRPSLLALAALVALPVAARAEGDISAEIARDGLARTEARLAALVDGRLAAPEPVTDADRFALGGVRFLLGIEKSLQLRWKHGLNASYSELPVLRLPLEPNPNPEPWKPELVRDLFAGVLGDMAGVTEALAPIPETTDMGLEIALNDLWFDIDADGKRDEREDLFELAGTVIGRGPAALGMASADVPPVKVRFDAADVAWLDAYAHFLSGVSETVLAYDPTEAIRKTTEANAKLAEMNQGLEMVNAMDQQFGFFVDRIAVIEAALDQEPDAERAKAAHGHFLAMIARNRDFWRLVKTETDNTAEWVPNDSQQSALGMPLPPGTGDTWLAVLGDAEALLQGKLLVPYWRLGNGAGINIGKLFTEPRAIDVMGWVQGHAALPYAEKGQRISSDNWWRFQDMFYGDAMLFAVFLN